ncbi:hypothetical protein BMR10_10870 [Methylococcaceae bacterium CS4]|nr:hypothetical protein BMR10_10870 [Methylococcaceae bacterium CS4]
MSKTSKKNASMDALLHAAAAEETKTETEQPEESTVIEPVKRRKGRPKKAEGNRQQLPTYLPEPLYFEMLDYVNLKKRSDRQYSLNDLVLEGLDLWLASIGKPSIEELIKENK